MAEVITMLALSPTMEEGTIAAWLKAEGESVEEGEIIAEIETDKATMEMESFFEGTVLKVLVKSGDTVPVGAPMAVIGEAGEDPQEALDELGAGDGGGSDQDDSSGSDSGSEEQAAQESEQSASSSAAPAAASDSEGKRIKASPLARRIAADNNLELSAVTGTGPGGRIIRADVEDALEAGASAQSSAPSRQSAPAAAPGEPIVVGEMPDASASFEPMSQMRKTIARRMTQVWQNTPFFYLTMEIDMGAAMAKRKEFNNDLAAAEVDAKISVNDMIVKACALALRDYPRMNTAFAGDELATFDQVHIGVAVALDEGLITPTLRDADKKSLVAISRETRELATKARDKKLKPGEYGGSTFSISNLGMYGIDHFQAVINPPESGILACGAVQQVPVVKDGEITVGTRMKVTLTCDHRAVDGAIGAEFLRRVKKMLEHPTLLLI